MKKKLEALRKLGIELELQPGDVIKPVWTRKGKPHPAAVAMVEEVKTHKEALLKVLRAKQYLKDEAAFFEQLGIPKKDIEDSIRKESDRLMEFIGYAKRVTPLLGALQKALEEARKLRSAAKPDSPAHLGAIPGTGGVSVDVEKTLLGLIGYVNGVDRRQRDVMGANYKTNWKDYAQKGKRGWANKYLALIAAEDFANRAVARDGKATTGYIGAGIFFYLGYDISKLKRGVSYQLQWRKGVDKNFSNQLAQAKKVLTRVQLLMDDFEYDPTSIFGPGSWVD